MINAKTKKPLYDPPVRLVVVLLVVAAGCREDTRRELQNPLRDEARTILETWCGNCHINSYPTALPKALAIYDLSEADFAARLSPAQLSSALHRLAADLGPDGEPRTVPARDRARFAEFVVLELARRNPR